MPPLKFALPSQKKDTNQIGGAFGNPFKRSNFDVTTSATLGENTPKREIDNDFSHLLSFRHLESQAPSSSAYLHHAPQTMGNRPPVSPTEISFQPKDEPIDIDLNSRTFKCSTPSSRDYPKRLIGTNSQELNLNAASREMTVEAYLGPAMDNFRKLLQESAQQRERIEDLELQLAAKKEENIVLSSNIFRIETAYKQATDKHKDALGRAAKNYSALKSELDSFKRSIETSSLIISEAKATTESLAALRNSTQISLRDLESMFDGDGRLILTAETRETVRELRSELSKTQQVADLLRDRLHTMGSDLAGAQARNLELEELTTADRNRSESTALKIRQSADQMAEVTRYLQEQKSELVQAVTKAYEMEQQLVNTQTRLQEAESVINSMKEEMATRDEFHEEQGAKLSTLRHTIDFQEGNVKALEARVRKAEAELVQALNRNHELQGRLDSAIDLEKNLAQQTSRLLLERDATNEKLKSVERKLVEVQASEKSLSSEMVKVSVERSTVVDMRRDASMYREKYADCQVTLRVLQERFDDQCVTLAASKESIGELQERLHIAERQATVTSIESKREMIHLQEQNGMLKSQLDRADKEIEAKAASFQALQIESSRKEGTLQTLLETERSGKEEASGQVQQAKTKTESLLKELAQRDDALQDMVKQLAAAEVPSTEHEREIAALKVRITQLEATEKNLAERAVTISHRYENNDLNDDERTLVALLMQKARAMHDREMVEKTNEIKRRDNIMKQDKARIIQLEDVLARRFHDESCSASVKGTDEQSNPMPIDSTKAQGPSSHDPPETRGGGREGPSISTTHGAADGASANPFLSGPSSRSAGHPIFAKLCREATDEIADFEDNTPFAVTGKRVAFTDEVEDESSRPARRVKHAKGTEGEKLAVDQSGIPAPGPGAGAGTNAGTGNKKKAPRRR